MRAYRDCLNYPVYCAISGDTIPSPYELHVDHKSPTFLEIVTKFLKLKLLNLEDIAIIGNGESVKLADINLSKEFYDYHSKTATYQPLTKQTHIDKTKKKGG